MKTPSSVRWRCRRWTAKKTLLTGRLSVGQRWRFFFFRAPSPPAAAVRRARLRRRSVRAHTRPAGGREAGWWEADRGARPHNARGDGNASHHIGASAWLSPLEGAACTAALPLYEERSVPRRGGGTGGGGARPLTHTSVFSWMMQVLIIFFSAEH